MDIQDKIKRYEAIEKRVNQLATEVQRDSIEIEYDKKNLKEKMEALQAKGVEFKNVSELEGQLGDMVDNLEEILSATERQLRDLD